MAVFRAFYRSFGRMLFVSFLCFACGFLSARAEEYTIAYLNQHGDEISDLTPDRYTEEELPLAKENLPNSEAVSIATGCELADELWYWDDKMSEPVDEIESVSDKGTTLYGNLDCGENRIVTLNPEGKEGIGSEGTRTLYYYRNLGESGEFFYNEYNGSKSASGVASTVVLPTYDDESYTFLGYYADPDDMETQCVDERGYITEYGFQQMAEGDEGETSWDAVYIPRVVPMNTIQLLPMYGTGAATSPGTGYIYGKPSGYGGGIYDAISGGNQISSITIPTWSGRSFLGYYSSTSSTSTQYINSVGNITAAGIAKAQENPGDSNQTWYGHWSGTYNLHYDCSTNYNVGSQQGYGTHPADESHSAGQSVTLQPNQGCYPTDPYYSFGGWNCFNRVLNYYSGGQFTSTDYDSGPINNGYSLTMPYNDVWCEPIWIPSNVTLSYNCGWLPNTNTPVSGSAPSSVSGSAPLGGNLASAAVAQNTCTIDTNTYSFVGWYCPGVKAWISEPGGEFSITEDATCYAVWAENNPCAPGSEASNSPEILGGTIIDWNQIQQLFVSLNDLSGMCSETVGSYPGQIGTPSSTSGNYCWCQATSYNSTPLNNYPWVFVQYYNGCNVADCQSWCSSSINRKDPDYFFNVSLLSNPICEYTLDYDCGTVGGTAPSSVSGIIPTNITQNSPMSLASTAPGCNNGNNTLSGWTCYASSDTGQTTPLTSASYSLDTMPYDNVTCYANWVPPQGYTVTYNCDNGNAQQSSMLGGTYNYGATVTLWTQNGNSVGSCDVPSNRVFVGWNCYFDNPDAYPPQATYDTTGYYQTVLYLSDYTESGTAISVDNVICDAQWACDTANGYTWDNYYQTCTNEYMIYYNPGNHGQYISGYNWASSGFGPGASNGGGTFGQYWSTQTLTGGHVEPADACYEFCGWSTVWNDTCGSANILTAGAQQPNVWDLTTYLNLYAVWQCASGCVASGDACVSAPATYIVTYHGGTCAPSALDYQSNPINAGDSYTVENPDCPYANSHFFIPTDDCYEFVGWSEDNPASVQNPTIGYNNCNNCVTQTGSCGTINSVSANIDLYAICNVKNHSVIYHDCDDTYTYTDSNAVWIGQSPNYTPLSPSAAPLSSSNLEIDPLSSFQGWATSPMDVADKSWCTYESDDLYPILYGGNGKKTKYNYSVSADKLCHDIDLYAVCCDLNLDWVLNGGSWPTGSSGNQTTCEYGASAGATGSIGYGQTPLQTPLRTGYTFTGWKVTDYSTP